MSCFFSSYVAFQNKAYSLIERYISISAPQSSQDHFLIYN